MQFILNSLSKMQRKASPSERTVLSSRLARLPLLLTSPAGCVTNSRAVQTCWGFHWELLIWEMHRNLQCLYVGRWLKSEFPQDWHCVWSTSHRSLTEMWEERSQRRNVQGNTCPPLQTQPQLCEPRWPGEGSSPGAPIWALDGLPGFLTRLADFW